VNVGRRSVRSARASKSEPLNEAAAAGSCQHVKHGMRALGQRPPLEEQVHAPCGGRCLTRNRVSDAQSRLLEAAKFSRERHARHAALSGSIGLRIRTARAGAQPCSTSWISS
jgi:hypothetical protein